MEPRLLFASLALFIGANTASAQLCSGPDGLTGPCCSIATLNMPILPPINLPSVTTCWAQCNPFPSTAVTASWSPPAFLQCGVFGSQLTILDSTSTPVLSGFMRLDYSRTWSETNFDGDSLQVWRFLAKVEISAVTGAPPGCPVPQCLSIYPDAFFFGHLDYALNCSTGNFEPAFSLFHSCDVLVHNALLSSDPGPAHPSVSFAIVGPDVPANPFVPGISPPFSGAATGGAIRNVGPVGSATCLAEEPIAAGGANLITLGSGCICPLSAFPPQYTAQIYTGTGTCPGGGSPGSDFDSILTPPPLLWVHSITASLGRWNGTGPGTPYPGPEGLWTKEGFFFHGDTCALDLRVEFHCGVMNAGGFPVVPDSLRPWQTQNSVDMASNYSQLAPFPGPWVGFQIPTRHVTHSNY